MVLGPMDLSMAYDCLPHELLIAKLAAYGFGPNSPALISNYFSRRKQRVKVGSTFSEWREIVSEVPQGSFFRATSLQYLCQSIHLCQLKQLLLLYHKICSCLLNLEITKLEISKFEDKTIQLSYSNSTKV